MNLFSNKRVWIVTDGKAGHLNQCLGLADALGASPEIKQVTPGALRKALPGPLWPSPLKTIDTSSAPPWPNLVIAAGRLTAAPVLAIRRAAGGVTFCVQIQDPIYGRARIDLIAAPAHDRLSGPNVVETSGALNQITPERCAAEAKKFQATLSYLPRPLVAVLIGGTSDQYRMTGPNIEALVSNLKSVCADGAGLAVTMSRRTGSENEEAIRSGLADLPAWIWDGTGQNPYLAFLGLADAIVVTEDSVSMLSEACSTGKPVFLASLDGGSEKFRRFHTLLRDRGMIRPFAGKHDSWSYRPLADTANVAQQVERRYTAFASDRAPS
ncbi:MAG: mitochondrial fission ELM1 family protein [Pseudomonadota bacterium]|nr:mitochondrial fission ELM1 family protein [Pseudomonadota bacterium]